MATVPFVTTTSQTLDTPLSAMANLSPPTHVGAYERSSLAPVTIDLFLAAIAHDDAIRLKDGLARLDESALRRAVRPEATWYRLTSPTLVRDIELLSRERRSQEVLAPRSPTLVDLLALQAEGDRLRDRSDGNDRENLHRDLAFISANSRALDCLHYLMMTAPPAVAKSIGIFIAYDQPLLLLLLQQRRFRHLLRQRYDVLLRSVATTPVVTVDAEIEIDLPDRGRIILLEELEGLPPLALSRTVNPLAAILSQVGQGPQQCRAAALVLAEAQRLTPNIDWTLDSHAYFLLVSLTLTSLLIQNTEVVAPRHYGDGRFHSGQSGVDVGSCGKETSSIHDGPVAIAVQQLTELRNYLVDKLLTAGHNEVLFVVKSFYEPLIVVGPVPLDILYRCYLHGPGDYRALIQVLREGAYSSPTNTDQSSDILTTIDDACRTNPNLFALYQRFTGQPVINPYAALDAAVLRQDAPSLLQLFNEAQTHRGLIVRDVETPTASSPNGKLQSLIPTTALINRLLQWRHSPQGSWVVEQLASYPQLRPDPTCYLALEDLLPSRITHGPPRSPTAPQHIIVHEVAK